MRGEAIPIPVPRSGWRTDQPVHEIPPDALFDGRNLAIEPDGLLHPRKGLEALVDPNGNFLPTLDSRVMAGVGFVDTTGAAQIVVSTLFKQYVLLGGVWVDISNPTPTTGDKDTPYRLVPFGQLDGRSIVYLIDGSEHDDLMSWTVGTPNFTTVVNTNFNANALTQLAASDMAVVADRLVVIDTNEKAGDAPGRHAQRVRWSAVLDGTNWPIGAWNELYGIGNLIAIRQSSRTSAVIYGESGAFTMSGVPGSDAGAFVFDRINNVIVPPCCPSGIVERGGVHWFTSPDLNVWVCDGQNANIASDGIHAGLMQLLAGGSADVLSEGVSDQRPVAVHDKIHERIIIFVTFQGETEAQGALCWNERVQCWETPWHFQDGITAAFNVTEMLGPTWLSLPNLLRNTDPLDWDHASDLYSTWNDIPETDGPALWVGTADGNVYRFYSSSVDVIASPIEYSAQWGLRWVNQTDRMEVNMVEVMLVPPNGATVPPSDSVRLVLSGLSTPYDPSPVSLLNVLINENDITTWIRRMDPTVAVSAFRPANFIRFVINGNSAEGGPLFAGATLYAFPSKRGDPLTGIGPNTATP